MATAVKDDQAALTALIATGSAPGPETPTRTTYNNFTASTTAFPDVPWTGTAFPHITVHATVPESASSPLPTVVIFNCYALGLQRCEWYFDYANHLASWNYAVLQFEMRPMRPVSLQATKYIVDCLLNWAAHGAANGSNPPPSFPKAIFDPSRLAFVGHSRGGCDAAYMLAQQPKTIVATAVLIDGVDFPRPPTAKEAMERRPPPGNNTHPVALIKAAVQSGFRMKSMKFSFNPKRQVQALLDGATVMSPGLVIAATAADFAHFSCVDRRFLARLRAMLKAVGMGLDTDRPYRSAGGVLGCFDQCAGMMTAWLEGVFRNGLDANWRALLRQRATWKDYSV